MRANDVCECSPDYVANGQCLACANTKVRDLNRERALKSNLSRRIPTWEEYLAFDGAHCRQVYAKVGALWRCPSCNRSRFELLRWTMLYPKRPTRHEGWAVGLHTHHDHGRDVRPRQIGLGAIRRISSFEPVVICEQCNSADGTAKKRLCLPANFTFSPSEIREFVYATPHGKHLIRYDVAQSIFVRGTTRAPLFFG